ncbi:MAG: UDP-N-acetylmuramoyl-L-alanine--D-glutamate ligase [Desulfotalea sp.]
MINHPLLKPGVSFAVMGLGVSGKAALRYAIACGAKVLVSDNRSEDELTQELKQLGITASTETGHSFGFLLKADVVFVSPGISCDDLLEQLRDSKRIIVGELSLVAPVIKSKVIAITGTNGKTTVTSLIGKILADAGKSVFVGGNIGTPLLDWLCEEKTAEYLVLELSSFQLEYIGDFRPDIGVLLNVTPDHLNRHGDMERYIEAKMNIFANQNVNDIAVLPSEGFKKYDINSRVVRFGTGEETDIKITNNIISFDGEDEHEQTFDLSNSKFSNEIGRLNSAPAIFCAVNCSCEQASIIASIEKFDLGEHRLELVAEIEKVKYYNDSKATNTGAVNAALSQLSDVILVVGGQDKGDDYNLLKKMVEDKVSHLICIGEATELIESALAGSVVISRAQSMKEAVNLASQLAKPGQNVLLSPACASFDMFTNYQDRGSQFKEAVLKLS